VEIPLLTPVVACLATETRFGLVIGFINKPQVVTTITYDTVTGLGDLQSLHANLLSISAVVLTYSVSLNHTPNKAFNSHNDFSAITHYHAHKTFESHAKASHDELSVAIFYRELCHLNTQTLKTVLSLTVHAENSLYCCKGVFTATLHRNGRGTDHIESQSRDSYLVIRLAR
jgi:hypothetical protein